MHRYFGDWYRMAAIEPKAEMLEKRWQAIETFVKSLDGARVLELVRVFHRRPPKDGSFIETYRIAFQTADAAFPMRGNDLELRVLAGAAVVLLLEGGAEELADAAALAMVCADYQGLRDGNSLTGIVKYAHNYLLDRSSRLRAPAEVVQLAVPELEITKLLEGLQQACRANNLPQLAEPLTTPFKELQVGIRKLAESVSTATARLGELQQLQQEECNILWWLFGEHSRDLGRRMADLGLPAACLVAGKELSDLTLVLPGPVAARAFLDKVLRTVEPELGERTTLQHAVNASPRSWRDAWMEAKNVGHIEDLCPVLFAIRKSLETDGRDDWVAPFKKGAGIKAREPIPPLDLALQVYQESLLRRAMERCG